MANVVDYVRHEFRDFGELPLSAVDSLALSELSYTHMPAPVSRFEDAKRVKTVPITALLRAEDYPNMFVSGSDAMNEARRDLVVAMAQSPRFRGMRIGEYAQTLDEDAEQQFAAVTFDLSDCKGIDADGGLLFVAFRGTDGTLVGWKEDFNMAFRCPVPSQEDAAAYVRSIASRSEGFEGHAPRLMIGGHSKGGNMAVYAAMALAKRDLQSAQEAADEAGEAVLPVVQGQHAVASAGNDTAHTEATGAAVADDSHSNHYVPRLVRVFNHDGPGFGDEITASPAYMAIVDRVDKTIPESSIIGLLMDQTGSYRIIHADALSIMQHLSMSWQVENGDFVTAQELTATAQIIDHTVTAWMLDVEPEERQHLIDEGYGVFQAAGYDTFSDLAENWTTSVPKIIMAARKTDDRTKSMLGDILKSLSTTAIKSIGGFDDAVQDAVEPEQNTVEGGEGADAAGE